MEHFETAEQHAAAIGAGPEVTRKDLADFSAATHRVFDLMRDGEWHTASEIIAASLIREGVVRVRELRLCGYVINKQKVKGSRDYEYRMELDADKQPVRVASTDDPLGTPDLGRLGNLIAELVGRTGQHRLPFPGGAVMTWHSGARELAVARALDKIAAEAWAKEVAIFGSAVNKVAGVRVSYTFSIGGDKVKFRMAKWKMPDMAEPVQQELFL